jgi:hypothetical protein
MTWRSFGEGGRSVLQRMSRVTWCDDLAQDRVKLWVVTNVVIYFSLQKKGVF